MTWVFMSAIGTFATVADWDILSRNLPQSTRRGPSGKPRYRLADRVAFIYLQKLAAFDQAGSFFHLDSAKTEVH